MFQHSFWTDTWNKLPAMGVKPDTITISGFSSGGSFADHYYITHSDTIKGAGMMAGTNYGTIEEAQELADANKIPALTNLSGQRVFIASNG